MLRSLVAVGWLTGLAHSYMRPGPIPIAPRDVDPALLYPEYNISVPVDHFHNDSKYEPHSNGFFDLRYYFDASYYVKGGPVIVLQGGETGVDDRLPYLQKGIVAQLAKATGGIGVILEHRYYGTSFPTPDLSTENLRFLTTDQALADQAYFAKNIVFPGLEHVNLTAPGTPYIAYGGSYAGAFVAFLRVLYPDVTWGAISSSGVTEAIYDYWAYYEPIREYGPPDCIATHQKLINIADTILLQNDTSSVIELKSTFGMESLTYSDDFASVLSLPVGYWQSRNWDPAVDSPLFYEYCGNITSSSVLFPDTEVLASNVSALIEEGGWGNESDALKNPMLNYIGWLNETFVSACDGDLDDCYGTHNASSETYTNKSVSQFDYLSWPYQYCSQWGFIQTGSGVPANELPLVSRLETLDYLTLICRYAFNITSPPDVEAINKYGGYNISYPRLAIVGGEADPWRPSTPLATLDVPDRLNDTSTASEPIILIQGAVHHWDENGLFPNETTPDLPPGPVRDAQAEIAQFVQEWMLEWKQHCIEDPSSCMNQ